MRSDAAENAEHRLNQKRRLEQAAIEEIGERRPEDTDENELGMLMAGIDPRARE